MCTRISGESFSQRAATAPAMLSGFTSATLAPSLYALDLLRQIMNFVIARGHIETNPAQGIRKIRRPALTRFMSREEIGRLHRVLDGCTGKGQGQQADILRLLLLAGCRGGEIVRLRWSEVEGDRLVLGDRKTGSRTLPLNAPARRILERQRKTASPFVFPSAVDPAKPRGPDPGLWYRVRRDAGIEDVRLHDLRHSMASHAVMNGVPVPVVSRLLSHSSTRMTMRYAHAADRDKRRRRRGSVPSSPKLGTSGRRRSDRRTGEAGHLALGGRRPAREARLRDRDSMRPGRESPGRTLRMARYQAHLEWLQ